MILHYKPIEESNKEDGIGFSSSDPTLALPEREGAGNHTNESGAAPTPALPEREGAGNHTNESVTAVKTDPQNISEHREICEKAAYPDNGTGGRKPGYITANPYTYPLIKD